MKKQMIFWAMALMAGVLLAAPSSRRTAAGGGTAAGASREADKVTIDQFPKTGKSSTLVAPRIDGGSNIPTCFTKPRKWIVLETKYQTYAKWQDQLTFTWHVLLETKSATEKDKADREKLAPYSYFTTSVTYANIPKGSHAASVCLHPSYLERFGEAKAIGLVITNPEGKILAGNSESEIPEIKSGKMWWDDPKIMDAKSGGEPVVERRQGLQERSKTIWALVNPNDYEMVAQ